MRKYITSAQITILALLLLVWAPSAQAKEPVTTVPTVTVQGISHIEVLPDQAVISIGVISTAVTAEAAQQENSTLSAAVKNRLLSLDITNDKIATTQYAVFPVYDTADKTAKVPAIVGYRVNHIVVVTIDELNKVGTIIDAALTTGANQISGISFKKKEEIKLKQDALRGAIKEATVKAETIADALGKRLVKPLIVTESDISISTPEYQQRYLIKADGLSTPIFPGSIQVNGSVTVVFELGE